MIASTPPTSFEPRRLAIERALNLGAKASLATVYFSSGGASLPMLAAWPTGSLDIAFDPKAKAALSSSFAELFSGWNIAFKHPKQDGAISSSMVIISPDNPASDRPIRDLAMRNAKGRQSWTGSLRALRAIFHAELLWGRYDPLDERPLGEILADPLIFSMTYNRELSDFDNSEWRDFPLALLAQAENSEFSRDLPPENLAPRTITTRL